MADPVDDEEPSPRRRPTISTMTFEALADFRVVLERVDTTVGAVKHTLDRHEDTHRDHETRIRVIESSMGSFMAGYTATASARSETKADFKWVWAALFTAGNFLIAAFPYVLKLLK